MTIKRGNSSHGKRIQPTGKALATLSRYYNFRGSANAYEMDMGNRAARRRLAKLAKRSKESSGGL